MREQAAAGRRHSAAAPPPKPNRAPSRRLRLQLRAQPRRPAARPRRPQIEHFVKRPPSKPSPPSKQQILAFIGEQAGRVGTREIARAFGLKNADRAELKRTLRELADEGRVEQRQKKLHHPGTLPPVVLADIGKRDADGELIAVPTEWDEELHGPPPKIRVRVPGRARPGEAAGGGDRALLRVEETGEDEPIRHSGRVIKIIDKAKQRVLGIYRALPNGGGPL